jgi:hypothetical protein
MTGKPRRDRRTQASTPTVQAEAVGPVITRDREQEAAFFDAAEIAPALREQVVSRLEMGQARYGDAWVDRTLEELLGEMREEAADLLGWGLLAAQHPVLLGLDGEVFERVARALARAVCCGQNAHAALVDLPADVEAVPKNSSEPNVA